MPESPDQPRILATSGPAVAVYKPAGLAVGPSPAGGDLCAWLGAEPSAPAGLLPVHRLDQGTSGVLLCAAGPEARSAVGAWFSEGQVRRVFLALVIGHAHKKGAIRRPLQDAKGRAPLEAVTRYHLEEALGGFSLLRVEPETGRKHQVRRHLCGIGLPVVGDPEYRPARFVRVPAFPGRLWLHLWRLVLPGGVAIEAPLPPELQRNLEALRAHAGAARRPGAR